MVTLKEFFMAYLNFNKMVQKLKQDVVTKQKEVITPPPEPYSEEFKIIGWGTSRPFYFGISEKPEEISTRGGLCQNCKDLTSNTRYCRRYWKPINHMKICERDRHA
jgi:hypothetical protein